MTHNEQALLRLVRLSLAADAVREDALLPTGIDWPALLSMAWRQGVSALVLDGLERLPESQRPPKPLLLQWIGRVAMMEQLYAKHEQCIASLADFYACHGIRLLLLKGVGCSWCWPRPQHRPVGDVDVYLFGQKEEADQLVEQELGMAVHREYHKHSTFSYHGVEVENHAKFIDDVSHKSNISFEKTLMDVLAQETCMASPIHHVCLPPPTFGALFLLRHTGEHFASNEILLRHVLDVGTYFQQHHAAMDWPYIYKVYKEQRMTRFFNAIATICVEYFGMDATCFSSEDSRFAFERDLPLANRILADIFAEKEKLPMSTVGIDTLGKKLKYAIGKSRRWWYNRWKYRLVYNENIFESFVWLAKNRMNYNNKNMYKHFFKRFFDFWIALIALICISPILIVVTIWLHFANKGAGAFFFQERPGLGEKIFKVIKFKSMTDERDANGVLLPDEERITAVGKFVRKTSIDELPQLFNVLKGDMALFGPRPLLPRYLSAYTEREKLRHTVRPGISGWAQVNGRNFVSWEDKLEYDVYYVEHLSLFMDLKVLIKTLQNMLAGSKDISVIPQMPYLDEYRAGLNEKNKEE